jgi:hypothetical protein
VFVAFFVCVESAGAFTRPGFGERGKGAASSGTKRSDTDPKEEQMPYRDWTRRRWTAR